MGEITSTYLLRDKKLTTNKMDPRRIKKEITGKKSQNLRKWKMLDIITTEEFY